MNERGRPDADKWDRMYQDPLPWLRVSMRADERINVLFIQSQYYFGADSAIHALIMSHLDRSRVTVHVAVDAGSSGAPSPALQELRQIPDLHIRPMQFGPTVMGRQPGKVAGDAVRTGGAALGDLSRLVSYARKHGIQIVHGTERPRDALYGFVVARLSGARAVTHIHTPVGDWMSPIARWPMQHDDALIAVSVAMKERAIEKGYRRDRIWSVHNAIDAKRWSPCVDGAAVRNEFGIPAELPVISIISRLIPWKGHDLLLEALAKVRAEGLPFKLLIVGDEDTNVKLGDGYAAQLKPKAVHLGLGTDVIFTGFRRDIDRILAASDIFAMPSFEEPFGLVYLEAMAMRTPVVALHSGGASEVIDHGWSGLLSMPNDAGALAANLARLLGNPSERQRMGAYGRSRVEKYFTPERLAQDTENVYRHLLCAPQPDAVRQPEALP
jgi:glycosyltransferase involved in cell wall biosynthesis